MFSLLTTRGAYAQTKDELEKARTLFKEGVAFAAADNCPAALTKFRAVANVKMTAQVAFNLAECEVRIGKLVSALGNYRLAASLPESKDVASSAAERLDALDPRIPRLTVKRGKNADTATIELDGSELGAQPSDELRVDPGSHTIVAKVEGKVYLTAKVSLAEKERQTYEVNLGVTPDQPPLPEGRSRTPGVVVLSLGAASGVVAGVMWGLRGGALSDLDARCGGDLTCPPSAQPIYDKGRTYAGVAEVTTAVAGVGVITGIILLATSGPPSSPKLSRRLEITPSSPGASIGGLSLVGRF